MAGYCQSSRGQPKKEKRTMVEARLKGNSTRIGISKRYGGGERLALI